MAAGKEQGFEGHGESSAKPSVSKGTFTGIGTYADLKEEAISVNSKSGKLQTGPKQ